MNRTFIWSVKFMMSRINSFLNYPPLPSHPILTSGLPTETIKLEFDLMFRYILYPSSPKYCRSSHLGHRSISMIVSSRKLDTRVVSQHISCNFYTQYWAKCTQYRKQQVQRRSLIVLKFGSQTSKYPKEQQPWIYSLQLFWNTSKWRRRIWN